MTAEHDALRTGVQRRTLRTLAVSQIAGGLGVASGVAVGTILAQRLGGSDTLAGLAQTMSTLGAALAAVPLSRMMAARGRRVGLTTGYGIGALGAVTVIAATATRMYPLMLVGMLMFGSANAMNLQARYTATDCATPAARGRALSTVVWATTVGAVVGPNLSGPGNRFGHSVRLPDLSGPFLFSTVAFLVAAAVVAARLRPDPLLTARQISGDAGAGRRSGRRSLRASLSIVRRRPRALLGLATMAVANTVMVSVMVMTPVHMTHDGASLKLVGIVISSHVAGMYALSPVVGWLVDRLGRPAAIVVGQLVFLAAFFLAAGAAPTADARLTVGLFLLGVGWSFGLIAGSTLLTESVPIADHPGVQGAADLVMGLCGACGGALAGVVLGLAGYGALGACAAVLVTPVLLSALVLGRRDHASRRPPDDRVPLPADRAETADPDVVFAAGRDHAGPGAVDL